MICEAFEISELKYLSFCLDSKIQSPVILFNRNGGGDIESEESKKTLNRVILKQTIDFIQFLNKKIIFSPDYEINDYDTAQIATKLGFNDEIRPNVFFSNKLSYSATTLFDREIYSQKKVQLCIEKLFKIFKALKLNLLEVNPFSVANETKKIVCFDAKAQIDTNKLIDVQSLQPNYDFDFEMPDSDANFVEMDGEISCIGNINLIFVFRL